MWVFMMNYKGKRIYIEKFFLDHVRVIVRDSVYIYVWNHVRDYTSSRILSRTWWSIGYLIYEKIRKNV